MAIPSPLNPLNLLNPLNPSEPYEYYFPEISPKKYLTE